MPAGAGMFAGVLIGRAVATERRAAFLARPQMDPGGADLHAFLALTAFWLFDQRDCVDMGTRVVWHGMIVISNQRGRVPDET